MAYKYALFQDIITYHSRLIQFRRAVGSNSILGVKGEVILKVNN